MCEPTYRVGGQLPGQGGEGRSPGIRSRHRVDTHTVPAAVPEDHPTGLQGKPEAQLDLSDLQASIVYVYF